MRKLILVLISFAVFGCKTTRVANSSLDFIGGKPAAQGQFPATVAIPGCTAAKIAPNWLLTAAHCVIIFERDPRSDAAWEQMSETQKIQDLLRASYHQGSDLPVSSNVSVIETESMSLPVIRTIASKTFIDAVLKGGERALKSKLRSGLTDLALIEVCPQTNPSQDPSTDCQKFSRLATAKLSSAVYQMDSVAPQNLGDPLDGKQLHLKGKIIVGGFGAEYEAPKKDRFYGGNTTALTQRPSDAPAYDRRLNFGITEGHMVSGAMAGFESKFKNIGLIRNRNLPIFQLGGGDSGGPVYLDSRRDQTADPLKSRFEKLIGVNSFTDFKVSHFTVFTKENGLVACILGRLKQASKAVSWACPQDKTSGQ